MPRIEIESSKYTNPSKTIKLSLLKHLDMSEIHMRLLKRVWNIYRNLPNPPILLYFPTRRAGLGVRSRASTEPRSISLIKSSVIL